MKKKILATLLLMVMTVATPLTAYARPVDITVPEGEHTSRPEEMIDGIRYTEYIDNDLAWLTAMEFLNQFDNFNNFKVGGEISIMKGDNVADFNDMSKWVDINDRKALEAQLGGSLCDGVHYVRNTSYDTDILFTVGASHDVWEPQNINEFSIYLDVLDLGNDGQQGELSESDIQLICSYLTNPKVTHKINDRYTSTYVVDERLAYEDYITIEGTLRTGCHFYMEYSNNYYDERERYFDRDDQVCDGWGYATITIPNSKIPNWQKIPDDYAIADGRAKYPYF